jgi:superfamily II DNA or RNA helicase
MATFDQFINSIIADGNDGKAFEKFCKHFLETSPEYAHQFEKVWLWDDWPNKWSHDKGIDLVAKYKGRDTYCAIQAKCYAAHNTVPYNEVTNFLADSSRAEIEDRILMMSTNKLNEKTSKEVISGQEKQVTILDRDYFENKAKFDYPSHISELGKAKAKPPATPRKHQITAINDVEKGLQENDRGQLIMACGTGKTFTTLWIKERLKANTVLVLLPSLSLLSQTMREWVWGANERFEALAVCSDPTVGKSKNTDEDISTVEVGKVTWRVNEIQAFLKTPNPKVIFCTYQSSELIQFAQEDEAIPQFDLVVCDEAHRCAGKANAGFATVLHEEKIRAKKRLFTTATPRYYGKSVQTAAEGRGVEIIGMDDEAKFGPVVHKLTFGQAIEMDMLTDYQVVVVGVDEPMVREWIAEGEIVSYGDENHTDARTLAAKIAVLKAIKDYDLKRVISFHTSINRAKEFASDVSDVAEVIDPEQRPKGNIWSQHVDGKMSAGKRRDLINSLKELDGHEIGLLTNARCLSEGVDVPSLDGVAFIDPRGSQVDIIQAVGRAIRKSDNKTKGTIVLPVFLETGDDPDTVIDASNFKPVWDVLKALRAHDKVLADELDQYRTDMGLGISRKSDRIEKVLLDIPSRYNSNFSDALTTRVVEASTANWWFWYGLLKEYVKVHGSALVPTDFCSSSGHRLGSWVDHQRQRFSRGELTDEEFNLLTSLPNWYWSKSVFDWENGLEHLKEFVAQEGHSRTSDGETMNDGFKLGRWVRNRRTDYSKGTLSDDKICTLESFPMWTWNSLESEWNENFDLLLKYYSEHGDYMVPQSYKTDDGKNLGSWLGTQIQNYAINKLREDRIKRFNELDGWYWTRLEAMWEKGFRILLEYLSENDEMPSSSKKFKGFSIGNWLKNQRENKDDLSLDQLRRLESVNFEFLPKNSDEKWNENFELLSDYYEKNGHAEMPALFEYKGKKLGNWVVAQRQKKANLNHTQIAKLDSLNFNWAPRENEWDNSFIEYKKYVLENDDQNVPSGYIINGIELGKWVRTQRSSRRPPTKERRDKLNSVGFIWDLPTYEWELAYSKLLEFFKQNGHANAPDKFKVDDFGVGGWCYRQRKNKSSLEAWQIQKLNDINFRW